MNLPLKAFNFNNNFTIALDGPAASGKGTIARLLAKKLNLVYFQSSIVYRSLAFECIKSNIELDNITEIIKLSSCIDNFEKIQESSDLENEYIGSAASIVASILPVRENLSKYLIQIISSTPRIIMEGRDIGLIIAPNADLKIFLTSSLKVRTQRRYNQLRKKGNDCMVDEVFSQLKLRDERDTNRSYSPLNTAPDALLIDSSNLLPEGVLEKILEYIRNATK